MLDVYDKHLHLVAEWKLPLLPKHHLMVHLIIRQLTQGNALGYAVFVGREPQQVPEEHVEMVQAASFRNSCFSEDGRRARALCQAAQARPPFNF